MPELCWLTQEMRATLRSTLLLTQHLALALGNVLEACPGHTLASLVDCAERNHRSQFAEDVSLLPSLLLGSSRSCAHRRADKGERNATHFQASFVELGAYDGIAGSNTFLLETCCSWKGVLLEANPENWEKLKNSKRNATMVHSGVCDHDGTFQITKTGGVFAGAAETLDPKYRHRNFARSGSVEVKCDRLTSILEREHHRHLGFMSLDVEGAEELVLRNTDLRRIGVLVFEKDRLPPERQANIVRMLYEAGLKPSNLTIRANSVWAKAGISVLPYPRQAYPPQFSRDQLHDAMREATRRCHDHEQQNGE